MREFPNNNLYPQMLREVSQDPFLALLTLTHTNWGSGNTVRIVNNTENIISRGQTFTAFPFSVELPPDDNESQRVARIAFDNVGLDFIPLLRQVTTPISAKIEMVLASTPDIVQIELTSLKLVDITYDLSQVTGELVMDDMLNLEFYSERYTPVNFRGIF